MTILENPDLYLINTHLKNKQKEKENAMIEFDRNQQRKKNKNKNKNKNNKNKNNKNKNDMIAQSQTQKDEITMDNSDDSDMEMIEKIENESKKKYRVLNDKEIWFVTGGSDSIINVWRDDTRDNEKQKLQDMHEMTRKKVKKLNTIFFVCVILHLWWFFLCVYFVGFFFVVCVCGFVLFCFVLFCCLCMALSNNGVTVMVAFFCWNCEFAICANCQKNESWK